jgi:hypothetical protein
MNKNNPPIRRRKALKGIAGAGTFLNPNISYIRGMERKVEITIVRVKGEPFITKQVPKDWWEHEQKATDMLPRFERKYGGKENVKDVCVGTAEERISGRKISSIVIQVEPGTTLNTESKRRGVPIEVEQIGEPSPVSCNESNHDPVPGGVSSNNDGTYNCGYDVTTTGKVDYNGSPAIMTCAHHYDCSTNPNGETQYQCEQNVGECATYDRSQDWLVFTETSDSELSNGYTAYIDAESHAAQQSGVVSDSGLHDLKSNDTEVYQMGITTCETGWEVEKLYKSWTPCDFSGSYYVGLKPLDKQLEGGDSGGPFFHYTTLNGEAYNAMIAPTYATTSDPERGWGYAAWKIEDIHDSITFPG